jgi:hypothetical protein
MGAAVGLTIVKKFTYRGDPTEEWSNQYWLTGTAPVDATAWNTLLDAVILTEKACYSSATSVVRCYGYDSDDEYATAVHVRDMTAAPVAGTLVTTGGVRAPGDSAVWIRWTTSRFGTTGKRIYLRKYFHDAYFTSGGTGDAILAAQASNLMSHGATLQAGTTLGSRTITARGHTDTIVTRKASDWVTTRTLKRRGRRPGA